MNLNRRRIRRNFYFHFCKAFCLAFLFIFFFNFSLFSQDGAISKNSPSLESLLQVSSIESDFLVERISKMSDKPLVSRGKFIFEYPNRLRWEYQTPSESGFLIDGEKVLFWKVNEEKLKTRDVSSNKRAKEFADIMLMFISINIAEIEKTYIVERLNGELLLTSKKDASKSLVKSVRIRTDEKMSAVKEVIILSQKNEETLIMFSNLKINQKLPENAFKI